MSKSLPSAHTVNDLDLAAMSRRAYDSNMGKIELWQQIDQDLYEVLKIPRDASAAQIQNAWRDLAKRTHPDHGGSPADFHAAQIAYQVLSDPVQRQRYNLATRQPAPDPQWEQANGFRESSAFRYSDYPSYHAFPNSAPRSNSAESRWEIVLIVLLCAVALVLSFTVPVLTPLIGSFVILLVAIRYAGFARGRPRRHQVR